MLWLIGPPTSEPVLYEVDRECRRTPQKLRALGKWVIQSDPFEIQAQICSDINVTKNPETDIAKYNDFGPSAYF
jgi:hypothetical protein